MQPSRGKTPNPARLTDSPSSAARGAASATSPKGWCLAWVYFLFNFLSVLIFMLYWSIVDLQYYISLTCTAKRVSYTYIYIPILFPFFFSYLGFRISSRVLGCYTVQVLVDYLYGCVCVNSKLLIYPSPSIMSF